MDHPMYKLDGEIIVPEPVDNNHVRLWRRTGQTRNPGVVASADAVAYEGTIYTVHIDRPLVLLQHWVAGIQHRFHCREEITPAAVTFEKLDPIFIEQWGDADQYSGGGE